MRPSIIFASKWINIIYTKIRLVGIKQSLRIIIGIAVNRDFKVLGNKVTDPNGCRFSVAN